MTYKTYKRKGQSAIEYLTTYGWALLAIVLVGAILVQMGVFNQCNKSSPRFSGQEVGLDTWAFTDTNSISFVVEAINNDVDDIGVAIDTDDDGTYDYSNYTTHDISSGQQQEIQLGTSTEFSSGECATAGLRINYTMSGISGDIKATGAGNLRAPVP